MREVGQDTMAGQVGPESSGAPYVGEDIVPETSFLRFLPVALNKLQRMRIDALVYSADVLTYNWGALTQAAASAGADPSKFTRQQRIAILSSAWAIVDHLNTTRQIVQALLPEGDERGPLTRELLRLLEPFRNARNRMDHLNQNLPNMSATRGGVPPMLGSVSYVYVDPQVPRLVTSLMIQTGAPLGEGWVPVINPIGQKCQVPVGLFQLYAFGEALELGPPLNALREWAHANTLEWETQLRAAVEEAAIRTGKSFEELFAFIPPGLVLALKMPTEPPTDAPAQTGVA